MEEQTADEQNREINSSDTENASPAIAYGPKDVSSVSSKSLWFFDALGLCYLLTTFYYL